MISFRHDDANPNSLGGTKLETVYADDAGMIWVASYIVQVIYTVTPSAWELCLTSYGIFLLQQNNYSSSLLCFLYSSIKVFCSSNGTGTYSLNFMENFALPFVKERSADEYPCISAKGT